MKQQLKVYRKLERRNLLQPSPTLPPGPLHASFPLHPLLLSQTYQDPTEEETELEKGLGTLELWGKKD